MQASSLSITRESSLGLRLTRDDVIDFLNG
jgi:hypothetical protein